MPPGTAQQGKKRGRKPKDPQLILDALERLLSERAVHELHVEDILGAAGVSRATFYAHFATKFAAATALFDQVLDEIEGTMAAYVERPDGAPPLDALRKGIEDSTEVWFRHRGILQTIVQNAHAVPEFAEPMQRIRQQVTRAVAAEIERERAAGLAPGGHDAGEISAALVDCTIHLLHLATEDRAATPESSNVAHIIATLWYGTVYRVASPPG
jgi:AcrR family transcriptional regulator